MDRQRDGKDLLVFGEIPYNVIKSELVRQLDALRLEKEVQGVLDVRDLSVGAKLPWARIFEVGLQVWTDTGVKTE